MKPMERTLNLGPFNVDSFWVGFEIREYAGAVDER